MEPKLKAKELVLKFAFKGAEDEEDAKEFALITVDELILEENKYNNGSFYPSNYWQEVKQEIEKL
jgi:hypothetical protein